MKPPIPYEKLSKRQQRTLDRRRRNDWGPFRPVTRVVKNKKGFDRTRQRNEDSTPGFFMQLFFRVTNECCACGQK